jgi:NADH-quinone oxidoreductase subunit A
LDSYLAPYAPVLIVLGLAGALCLLISYGATVLGPRRYTEVKEGAFECGNLSEGDGHSRHSVKFYLVALLFIVFDVESVFVYPWGALLRDFQAANLGWFAFAEMMSFMVTLALGLIYVWRKGALDWNHS